jgi:hypothetical protein
MAGLLEDIATWLISNHVATKLGVDIFTDVEVPNPDHIIILNVYGGDPPRPYEIVSTRFVQALVRDTDWGAANSGAWALYNLFNVDDRILHFTASRTGFVFVKQPPFRTRIDLNGRALYGFNMEITTKND